MSENAQITRALSVVGLSTLASRILGLVREMVIAFYFGAGLATDAFFVAFQIPNTFRRLMAEGSLTISFIPVFSDTMIKKGRQEALTLANTAFTFLTLILVILTIGGIVFASPLVKILVPGYREIPNKIELTVFLTRTMFPYIFFISLVALCMGILNSLRHFAAPALAPVLLNLSMIFSLVILYPYFHLPIMALAIGVILGGFLQLSFQVPFLRKKGINLVSNFDFRNPGLRKIRKLMVPAIFGSAIYQINIYIIRFLASFLPQGSVSYLFYASRLMEFPLGIFVFALSSAVLPSLSSLAAKNESAKLKEVFLFSFRLAMFIVIPAMVGLAVLRIPIIHILLQRGSFTPETTIQTAVALLYYALGLWAIAGVRVAVPVFYALHDTKTPVKVGAVCVLANILFSLLLMGPLKHGGLALALSLSSILNLALLVMLLRKKIGPLKMGSVIHSLGKTILASLGMGVFSYFICFRIDWLTSGCLFLKITHLGGAIGGGVLVYLVLAYFFRCPELGNLKKTFQRRLSSPVYYE